MLADRSAVIGGAGPPLRRAGRMPFASSATSVMVAVVAPLTDVHACLARAREPPLAPNPNLVTGAFVCRER